MISPQPNFFSCDLYDWAGHTPPKLQLLRPGVVLLAHGIWEHAVTIYNACGTRPRLILRWMDLDVTQHTPEQAADFICAKAKALMALGIKCLAHGLNEQYTNRPRARAWELKFIERCHWHGVPTICSNYAFANFDDWEAQDFKDVWTESDYNGPHLYDLFVQGQFEPRSETSLRYRKWKNYPIEKHLCTEFGIEDGGWQILDGLTAGLVRERLLENVLLWKADGMLAATYFCMAHINELKWGPYYGLDSMYRFWGENSPPFEPGGDVPIPIEFDQAQAAIIEAKSKLNGAKTNNVTWFDMASDLEKLDSLLGDAFNLVEKGKKALGPTL